MRLRLIEIKLDGDYTEEHGLCRLYFISIMGSLITRLSKERAQKYRIGEYYDIESQEIT